MQPRDFLDLANTLVSGGSPVECRTAISRSYYAVFLAGRELLKSWGFTFHEGGPKGGTDHWLVTKRLQFCYENDLSIAASKLIGLRSQRNDADYLLDDAAVESPRTAQATVAIAHNLMSVLDEASTSGPTEKLLNAIRDWERTVDPNRLP